jgi:hypothetical protein
MTSHFIPIDGLTVVADWVVGPVVFRPSADVLLEIEPDPTRNRVEGFHRLVDERSTGAFAQVDAADIDEAIDLVAQAVDVLRVFQHVRHFTTILTQFGIAGDVGGGVVPYATAGTQGTGYGFSHRGEVLGWTFDDPGEWVASEAFQWVATAIGSSRVTPAQRRAMVGVQLLSDAIVEQRGAFKMVALVTALEAWLLERRRSAQTFHLARAVAFFGCGRHSGDLCGRSRETCPYLELDPAESADVKRLKRLRTHGALPPWRCSEWHRVVDWHEQRSDVVHGAGPTISYKDASNSLYWVLRYLTEPILKWLSAHPEDPVRQLTADIGALPPAPDWESRLGSQL